ncbi:hypothetical protein TcCL_Unassigned00276, partial [Trypanosoma cruzi]
MESNRGEERCGRHTRRANHTRRESSSQACTVRRTPRTTHTPIRGNRHTQTHTVMQREQHTDGGGRDQQGRHTRPHHMYYTWRRRLSCPHLSRTAFTQKWRRSAHSNKKAMKQEKSNPRTPREFMFHSNCRQYSSQGQYIFLWPSLAFSTRHFMQAQPPSRQQQQHTQ